MKKQKAAKEDFSIRSLPHSRVEVFLDIIKQRYDVLFKMGVVLLALMLPFFACELFADAAYSGMAEGGEFSAEDVVSLQLTVSLIKILPFAVFGLGLAGVMKIARELVWGEPIFFTESFFSGIRQNRIIFVFVFLIAGSIAFFLEWLSTLISVELLKLLPFGVCAVTLLPVAMFVLSATVVYKDGFLSILISSFKFFIKSAPIAISFVIVLSAAFLINLITLLAVKIAVAVVLTVCFLPLYIVAWTLYSHSVFDKMVNSALYPDLVDKGVYRNDPDKTDNAS